MTGQISPLTRSEVQSVAEPTGQTFFAATSCTPAALGSQLRFLDTAGLTRNTPTQQQLALRARSNFPTEPFPGLPIGDKGAFTLLPVSAPNSSQKYNSLQNQRDRRPSHSHPVGSSRLGDRSPHHAPDHGCAIVVRETKTRLHVPVCSTSRTPTSSAFFTSFCHRAATTTPRHAPPPQVLSYHFRPNWGLSSKCSLIIPIGARFSPVLASPRPG